MLKPEGIIPAMITPFHDDESIDESGLRLLVNRSIREGVHGIFCLGTNGEFFALSDDEKLKVVEIIVDEAGGRVPVYAGTGGINTAHTIKLTQAVERLGVDAVSIITPYFLNFSQEELVNHYERLAASVSLPIMLYNIPNNTGNTLQPATVAKLSKIENIVGIKDSSGRMDLILQYLDSTEKDFSVMAGTDSLILPALMAGAKGAVASTANLVPRLVVSIYEHWRNGRLLEAQLAQDGLRPLRQAFQLGTLPSVLKAAHNGIGLPAGPSRQPVLAISEQHEDKMAKMLQFYRDLGAFN